MRLIEEAAALPSPEPSLLNDHAMILVTRGASRQPNFPDSATADFDRAEDLLRRAEALGPHPLIYENWASLERYRGHEDLSARFAEKAREMRARKSGS